MPTSSVQLPDNWILDVRYLDPEYWDSGSLGKDYYQYITGLDQVSGKEEMPVICTTREIFDLLAEIYAKDLDSSSIAFNRWQEQNNDVIIAPKELMTLRNEYVQKHFLTTDAHRNRIENMYDTRSIDPHVSDQLIYGSESRRSEKFKHYDEPICNALKMIWGLESLKHIDEGSIAFLSNVTELEYHAKNATIDYQVSNSDEIGTYPMKPIRSLTYKGKVFTPSHFIEDQGPVDLLKIGKYEEAVKKHLDGLPSESKEFKWTLNQECIETIRSASKSMKTADILETLEIAITNRSQKSEVIQIDEPDGYYEIDGWLLYRRHAKDKGYRLKFWTKTDQSSKDKLIYFSALHKKNEKTEKTKQYLATKFWPREGLTALDFHY